MGNGCLCLRGVAARNAARNHLKVGDRRRGIIRSACTPLSSASRPQREKALARYSLSRVLRRSLSQVGIRAFEGTRFLFPFGIAVWGPGARRWMALKRQWGPGSVLEWSTDRPAGSPGMRTTPKLTFLAVFLPSFLSFFPSAFLWRHLTLSRRLQCTLLDNAGPQSAFVRCDFDVLTFFPFSSSYGPRSTRATDALITGRPVCFECPPSSSRARTIACEILHSTIAFFRNVTYFMV